MWCPVVRLALVLSESLVAMPRPLADVPIETIWHMFFLILMELGVRNGLAPPTGTDAVEPVCADRGNVAPLPGGPLVARAAADQDETCMHCLDPHQTHVPPFPPPGSEVLATSLLSRVEGVYESSE